MAQLASEPSKRQKVMKDVREKLLARTEANLKKEESAILPLSTETETETLVKEEPITDERPSAASVPSD